MFHVQVDQTGGPLRRWSCCRGERDRAHLARFCGDTLKSGGVCVDMSAVKAQGPVLVHIVACLGGVEVDCSKKLSMTLI